MGRGCQLFLYRVKLITFTGVFESISYDVKLGYFIMERDMF